MERLRTPLPRAGIVGEGRESDEVGVGRELGMMGKESVNGEGLGEDGEDSGETWWLEEALRELEGRLGYEENREAENNGREGGCLAPWGWEVGMTGRIQK